MEIYGVDMAKAKFDVCFSRNGKLIYKTITNNFPAIFKFLGSLSKDAAVVLEHTGSYGQKLIHSCLVMDIPVAVLSGYYVRNAFKNIKTKNDKVDSLIIREYALRFTDRLRWEKKVSVVFEELSRLLSIRQKTMKYIQTLENEMEARNQYPSSSIFACTYCKDEIKNAKKKVKLIEREMKNCIKSCSELNRYFKILDSIVGFGLMSITMLLVKTRGFTRLCNAKQMAAFAGVAPYQNQSGTVNKKSRTSKQCDQDLKTQFFMSASVASQHDPKMRYYKHVKKLEGKHHFVIMTNIANKMLRIAYALIRDNKEYQIGHAVKDPRLRDAV
ncbi:transposase [Halosquirtibacter laminarini]|uniref:Transposase n=1 Tax=Halosquirtibacter laminarini TaxID=3374600 RepID=A0AC61NRD5_9BACT|nr:transposase [Prolixibacteraceae bacterium]